MLKVIELSIKKAIIHRLDNQIQSGLELSDLELELDDELKTVIENHIKSGLEDGRIRYASFQDKTSNVVLINSNTIFSNVNSFVFSSKILAENLYRTMANKTISAADLIVCILSCNNEEYIGILKLDYKKHYISEVINKPEGKYIGVKKMGKGWPEIGSRLQKAAFVKRIQTDFDLIVLDRQQRKKDEGDISIFFRRMFLNAELLDDERTVTKGFIKGVQDYALNCSSFSFERKQGIIDSAISLVVSNEQIDVREFAKSIFNESENDYDDKIMEFLDKLEKHGVTRGEFDISKEVADIYNNHRRIELYGIKLDITTAIYNDSGKFDYKKYINDANEEVVDITIKGLKVKKWD